LYAITFVDREAGSGRSSAIRISVAANVALAVRECVLSTHFGLFGKFRERRLSSGYATMADDVLNYLPLVGRVKMRHHRLRVAIDDVRQIDAYAATT
jgi:hypothetical protein